MNADGITVEWDLAPSRSGERVEGEPVDTQVTKDAGIELGRCMNCLEASLFIGLAGMFNFWAIQR